MRFLAGAALFLLPGIALAAQFAPGALFLSKNPLPVGSTERVFAVVDNSAATSAFTGQMIFKDGDTQLASVAVSAAAGSAQTVSTTFKPSAGSHTITADLETQDGSVAQEESVTLQVIVPAPPASDSSANGSSNSAAAVESSQSIQNEIGTVSPQVESATAPAFNFVDGVRQSAANTINSQLAQVQPKVTPIPLPGQSSTGGTTIPSQSNWFWSIFYTIYFYLLTILLFVVKNAAVFYPVVAIIFLYILWSMFRRFRRA